MVNPFNVLISQLLNAYKIDCSANELDVMERADSLQHWLNSNSGTSRKDARESDFIARHSQARGASTL